LKNKSTHEIKSFKYKLSYLIIQITMEEIKKVKIELEEDVVNQLIQRKKVGDTYSDIVRGLLNVQNKAK
jgi:hypothetical protein